MTACKLRSSRASNVAMRWRDVTKWQASSQSGNIRPNLNRSCAQHTSRCVHSRGCDLMSADGGRAPSPRDCGSAAASAAPAPTATPRSGDPAPSAGQPGPARAQPAPRAITPPDQAPGKITASPYPPQTALIRARRTQITNPKPECLRTRRIIQNSPSICSNRPMTCGDVSMPA